MNKTVGDLLREARNKKGLALQNIERSTGIATHNLLAIELDQFSLLEADKLEGYLQTYAQAVDVPYSTLQATPGFPSFTEPEPAPVQEPLPSVTPISVEKQVKANFENIVKNDPAPKPALGTSAASANLRRTGGRQNRSVKEKSGGFFKLVVSLLLTAAVLFAGYTLYKQYFADVLTKKEAPAASSASSSSSSASASSSAASSSTPASSSSAPASDTKLAVTGGGDYLEVKATTSTKPVKIELSYSGTGASWIGVSNSDIGGVTLNAETPKATAVLNEGATQSLIELGVTQGVTIKINDQVLDMSAITNTATSSVSLSIQ